MYDWATSEAETHQVQPGWRIVSREGSELGFVIDIVDGMLVVRDGVRAVDLRIPERYIGEEDEGEMRASIVLDEREARSLYDGTSPPEA